MWTRAELKARAKEVLRLNYWKAVLVALIANFLSGSGGGGSSAGSSASSSSSSSSSSLGAFDSLSGEDTAAILAIVGIVLVIFLVVFAVALALSIFVFQPLYVGCCRFFINCGKECASLNDVTFAFSNNYMNIVKISFFQSLYTFLWSLLLFIPGIIKSYEYFMIPYLLAENPEITKEEAFALTKEMMTGDKWNTFVLGLSFIGWELLGLLTCCILNVFYVSPYTYLTFAELYKVLKNKITDPRFKEPTLMDASYQEPVYTYTGSSDSSGNPYL